MMHIFYKKTGILSLFLLSMLTHSQETLTKKIEKTLNMTNTSALHIDNKYGNVIINGWEENTISVTIDVKVSNKKKENAQSLIDRIVPEIKNTSNFVSIKSLILERSQSFFSKYFNKVNPIDFDKGNIDINYTIYLPINAEIDVTNKFGDVIIDNWTGKLKAFVEHGDLWINNALTNANINMKFGKLTTKSIDYGNINLKNSTLNIEKSKNLYLKTSGSDIEIDEVTNLELYSSKDDIHIKNVDRTKGDLQFSNIKIDTTASKINLSMHIAELRVSKIINPDAIVYINQESSEIHINITDASFKFNATLEQGVLRLPKTFSNINTTVIDKGKRIREISGNYGNTTSGTFSFTGKKGIIVLNE